MRSNDEEYLDSLLNSAQSNKIKPGSALSRMSSKLRDSSGAPGNDEPDSISSLVDNSSDNEDLTEIGDMLRRLDRDELLDEGMASMLDDIESPTDTTIPKFTIGSSPSGEDTRDPEEIALDEAIADAERMDAELQSGKFSEEYSTEEKKDSIVDLEEGDDALLEMAPEIVMPDENVSSSEAEKISDALESPEEILTDLLDEGEDSNLSLARDEVSGDSLSDVLDNIKEDSDDFEEPVSGVVADILNGVSSDLDTEASLRELEAEEDNTDMPKDEPEPEVPVSDDASSEADIENMSLSDLEAEMNGLLQEDVSNESAKVEPEEDSSPDMESLDELLSSDGGMDASEQPLADEALPSEEIPDNEAAADAAPEEEGDISMEDLGFTMDGGEPVSEDGGEKDEFNLNDMEASLDNLLGGEAGDIDSIEGEVAQVADDASPVGDILDPDKETNDDVSIPDLDALMNSLANDELEDLENTAMQDKEAGVSEEDEIPKEDILDALTEGGDEEEPEDEEGDGMEPSLEDLASIPERDLDAEDEQEDEPQEGKKKKKAKKEKGEKKEKKEKKGLAALFAKLFTALTEEENTEGLASLTDENQQVLDELAKDEKPKKEKKKKEKKAKEKKPPKPPKKPKEPKPPKPKKEKKPKEAKDDGAPEKIISPKKIALSGLFAASIGIFVLIPSLILPERIANQRANTAFEKNDYVTSYKMLYGKKMTEEQAAIYEQSRVLAWSERYLVGYQNYVAMGMKEEALDILLMGMRNKADLLEEATKFNVEIQVQTVYDSIESVLLEKYGLSADDIEEINSIRKDRDYTIRIMEIVGTLQS